MISSILMRPASRPVGGGLLGNHGDAVIGGEGEHVLVASDTLVELFEQLADDVVEPQQDVLDLVAARAEVVARRCRAPRS